LSDINQT